MSDDAFDGLVVREPTRPGEETVDGIPVLRDHDGPGADLVAFVKRLEP